MQLKRFEKGENLTSLDTRFKRFVRVFLKIFFNPPNRKLFSNLMECILKMTFSRLLVYQGLINFFIDYKEKNQ